MKKRICAVLLLCVVVGLPVVVWRGCGGLTDAPSSGRGKEAAAPLPLPDSPGKSSPPALRNTPGARSLDVPLEKMMRELPRPSTNADLLAKGFPLISNARRTAREQVVSQSIPELVHDLGNMMTILYCSQRMDYKGVPSGIARYCKDINGNIMVLRLIEEGRASKESVVRLLTDEIEECVREYGRAENRFEEARAKGEGGQGTSDKDEYYAQHRKYQDPALEFQRIHEVAYMSFHILANVDQIPPRLLAAWIVKQRKNPRYKCDPMNVWLVDCFYRQAAPQSPGSAVHSSLTEGLAISGKVVPQSGWDQSWDIHDPLLTAGKVNLRDIRTISVTHIPPSLPNALTEEKMSRIIGNFLGSFPPSP